MWEDHHSENYKLLILNLLELEVLLAQPVPLIPIEELSSYLTLGSPGWETEGTV